MVIAQAAELADIFIYTVARDRVCQAKALSFDARKRIRGYAPV